MEQSQFNYLVLVSWKSQETVSFGGLRVVRAVPTNMQAKSIPYCIQPLVRRPGYTTRKTRTVMAMARDSWLPHGLAHGEHAEVVRSILQSMHQSRKYKTIRRR